MFARTDRLMLRPSWPEDAEAIRSAISDEAIVRNLASAPWPYRAQDARQFAAIQHDVCYPNFLLFQRTDGPPRLIGSCGIGNRAGQAELRYWIARPYWGLGYASEAAGAVVGIAAAIGHRHLIAGHFTDNTASGSVLYKVGFHATGRVEMRYSKGRGRTAPCALYERSLSAKDAGDMANARRNMPMDYLTPYDAQLIAA